MGSLFRTWNIAKGGKQIINLTKISSFTLQDKTITFTMDHEKNGIYGSFFIFGGLTNKEISFVWDTPEDAKKTSDDIIATLDNYYKTKNS